MLSASYARPAQVRLRRRLGLRGVRVGEASHPGPPTARLPVLERMAARLRWAADKLQLQQGTSPRLSHATRVLFGAVSEKA